MPRRGAKRNETVKIAVAVKLVEPFRRREDLHERRDRRDDHVGPRAVAEATHHREPLREKIQPRRPLAGGPLERREPRREDRAIRVRVLRQLQC